MWIRHFINSNNLDYLSDIHIRFIQISTAIFHVGYLKYSDAPIVPCA